ncbi:MAG: ribose 5-phosphate isomerase B [Candidatus Omnitrophota bacterium]
MKKKQRSKKNKVKFLCKIAIACDHRGVGLKEKLKKVLEKKQYEVVDCGTQSGDSVDYPDFIFPAAELVAAGECCRGIGICYTGIGSSIVANKVRGIRASLCKTVEEAKLTRAHNDSNMLILGSGFLTPGAAEAILTTWLETPFDGGRHQARIQKIMDYEKRE